MFYKFTEWLGGSRVTQAWEMVLFCESWIFLWLLCLWRSDWLEIFKVKRVVSRPAIIVPQKQQEHETGVLTGVWTKAEIINFCDKQLTGQTKRMHFTLSLAAYHHDHSRSWGKLLEQISVHQCQQAEIHSKKPTLVRERMRCTKITQ